MGHTKQHSFTATTEHDFSGINPGEIISYDGSGIISQSTSDFGILSGSGTSNYISKFNTSGDGLVDSILSGDGSTISVLGNLQVVTGDEGAEKILVSDANGLLTYSAKTEYFKPKVAVSYFNTTNFNVGDDSNYWISQTNTIGTSANGIAHVPLQAGTVKEVYVQVYNASELPSGEASVLTLYTSGGGESVEILTGFTQSATERNNFYKVEGLNIPVSEGGSYFVFSAGTFVSNSTATQFRINLYMEV